MLQKQLLKYQEELVLEEFEKYVNLPVFMALAYLFMAAPYGKSMYVGNLRLKYTRSLDNNYTNPGTLKVTDLPSTDDLDEFYASSLFTICGEVMFPEEPNPDSNTAFKRYKIHPGRSTFIFKQEMLPASAEEYQTVNIYSRNRTLVVNYSNYCTSYYKVYGYLPAPLAMTYVFFNQKQELLLGAPNYVGGIADKPFKYYAQSHSIKVKHHAGAKKYSVLTNEQLGSFICTGCIPEQSKKQDKANRDRLLKTPYWQARTEGLLIKVPTDYL